ncbi:hypothetical protein DYB28_008574, partial [Aphanomyces astaci]
HSFSLPVEDHLTSHEIKLGPSKSPTEQKISDLFLKCSHTRTRRCKSIHHGYHRWTSPPSSSSPPSPSSATSRRREVTHVVFVVHGIGETYCKKRQADGTIVDYCYAMRHSTNSILNSHFPTVDSGIEYLPVDWSDVLGDMGDNLHATLHRISFDAMPFVREICNELLSDILMYMLLSLQEDPLFRLAFDPDAYIAFGAPVGMFLALRGRGGGDTLGLPTVTRMYNVNHSSQKQFAKDIGTAFNSFGKMFTPKKSNPETDADEEVAGVDVVAAKDMTDVNVQLEAMLARLNPRAKRLDFVLPIEALTPLAALTAHTGRRTMIDIEQAATVSILYDALLHKKSLYCHSKMLDESKKLMACKKDIEECRERIEEIEDQLGDIHVECCDKGPEAYASNPEVKTLLAEKDEEESLLKQMNSVLDSRKKAMRIFLKHKAMLDTSRKSLKNRQRRIVEKAYRTGLLVCQS